MKHLLYFILAVLIVYLIGSLLMADFLWILHTGFLGWIGAIFIILWFFLQIEKEYGGWNIEEEEVSLYFTIPRSPVFIRDKEENYIYMILPVNFNADQVE